VSDPANYTTQPNTVGCGIAAPTSTVFPTPPRIRTVSDETPTGTKSQYIAVHWTQSSVSQSLVRKRKRYSLVAPDRAQALKPDHTGMTMGPEQDVVAVFKCKWCDNPNRCDETPRANGVDTTTTQSGLLGTAPRQRKCSGPRSYLYDQG
jgi:hypothetical protein